MVQYIDRYNTGTLLCLDSSGLWTPSTEFIVHKNKMTQMQFVAVATSLLLVATHGFTPISSCTGMINLVKQSRSRLLISTPSAPQAQSELPVNVIAAATTTLQHYDNLQLEYSTQNPLGMGGGISSLHFLQNHLSTQDLENIREAVIILVSEAHKQRSKNSADGRIMLGICAENVDEALLGLKTWVPALGLPRGMLHGMDVDGIPIPPEELGSVYVKYNTGGSMTFTQMRKSGMGFDALWRPGDAVLETYDGDFRGIYLNVELCDGEFRQYLLPTDLFLEDDW